jgi:hypothetical protein
LKRHILPIQLDYHTAIARPEFDVEIPRHIGKGRPVVEINVTLRRSQRDDPIQRTAIEQPPAQASREQLGQRAFA